MIRISRQDATFSTLPAPLTATAAELVATLGRKFGVNAKSGYSLYMREKGLERRMGPNEKPMLLQRRRFEQAGYTELDKLEDLGREDNSYLCKLIYKATHASISAGEDDIGESLEFVDLSGKNVETIPIFLYKHAHEIVSLNLSKNRPFDLPTDFVQGCTSLRELVLSHMGIKRIPQAVKECYQLTRLDISNNHIVELDHIALHEVAELTSLKCHNNRLWGLPEYFSRFKLLKYLNLSNNRFELIPPVACEVSSLVELDISFNTISTVPPEIGQLVALERLVLLANTISSLPTTLSALVHLRELDCRRNCITDLSAISGISRLEVLRCEYNQASVLDANWAHMRILTASNNSVTRFALSGTGSTLTSLNLSHAKLASLATDMFDHLGSIENLVFDSNQIRVLPEGVGSLTNLVTLSIKNNILDELPATVGNLQRLQSLQISGNNLRELPDGIWHCGQLSVLNASSNLLKDFPDPPPTPLSDGFEDIDARKLSTISKAPSTGVGRLTQPLALSLQKLYLGDNRLGDDVFVPISLLTELRILNLSFNDIFEIPHQSLFKSQQLEELYLSGNKITSLPPEDLERLSALKLLYLNGNKLQTLPSELGKIKNLFALDVGSNVLKYNIANWPYDWNWNWNLELRYLNLSGNKRLEIKPNASNDAQNMPRSAKKRNLADFSALSRLHILGLMDVTLMIPSVPDENEDRRVRTSLSEINDMGYGIADTLGARVDVLSLVDIVIPRFRSKDDEAIFGLFDAVSKTTNTGAKLVKYLQNEFSKVFTLELSRLKSGEVTSDALRRAFLAINRDYGNLLLPTLESRRKDSDISLSDRGASSVRTGAAGIIVYIRKKKMYVANAGNALAVISSRGGNARLIAKKHEPFDAAEIARIRTAEGWISHRGAVNDEVEISRSFGFYNVFPAINAAPNIEEIELMESDEFVIIANRGLWEHMSYQVAVDVARGERSDPMIAAAKLRDMAISYGSSQNVMVMVVAVADLFKAKKDYRSHRSHQEDEGFFGQARAGPLRRGTARDEHIGDRGLNGLEREVAPPVGLVALVFTDIRNSTALWESNPGMQTAIRMHNQLLRRQLRAIGGYEVKTEGDAFMVSFPTVTSALLWCLTCQLELLREDWPQEILDSEEGKEITNSRGEVLYRGLSVRMGIHWGAPVCEADPITRRMDYFGPMVNRSSRISAVAEGGQISASQDVVDIIQEVVMDHKPAPSSLDSDSGEEEEEEWLDPSEKQDVMALRRLGFGITELGERRLKGLETAEMLSLFWPSALKDRVKKGDKNDKVQAEVHDPGAQMLDHSVIREFGRVCQRLEMVAANFAHPPQFEANHSPEAATQLVLAKRKTHMHPPSLSFAGIRPDSSDEELIIVLEHLIVRIEHSLSTLVLHQLGPFAEVLAALGGAMKSDPRYIMNALSRYGSLLSTM
ncbi:L domain-like protein [Meredithblackwellia eburnea MCA 4105]